jgi:hypothetical protein
MATDSTLTLIDAEIAKLKQVRSLLAHSGKIAARIIAIKTKIKERKTRLAAAKAAAKKPAKAEAKAAVKKPAKARKRRVLSPEARQRIADAQRRRWAAKAAAEEPVMPVAIEPVVALPIEPVMPVAIEPVEEPAKTRKPRVLSPEARQRIADAQRKRWAARKATA